jgi:hypothetical protein
MCHFILIVSVVGLCPMLPLAPASSAAPVNSALESPMPVLADIPDESPPIPLPLGLGDWVWEMMMDHLTVPLAPGDQNVWPLWMWRDQWYIAWDGQTRLSSSALPTAGTRICSSVLPAQTRRPIATRASEPSTRPGGKTCNTS